MILSTVSLLEATPEPGDDLIRAGLEDHVCRCGTYPRILAAVRRAGSGAFDGLPRIEPDVPPINLDRRPRTPWDLTPTAERDWFEILPDGLVVVLEPDKSGGWSTTSGAWLHVGGDGVVTAFTGKVDGGQDNRTGLSIILADSLGVPLSDVGLVMGDTDLCPHDAGTFGSRSTPDAGRELRVLGKATRRRLMVWRMLGRTSGGDRRARRRTATARGRPTGRSGSQRSEVQGTGGPSSMPPGVPRLTGRSIVTGTKRYPSDIVLPGMRHGQVLRPPAVGATLRSVDLGEVASEDGRSSTKARSSASWPRPRLGPGARSPGRRPSGTCPTSPAKPISKSHLRTHPIEDEGWEGGFHRESGDVDRALATAQIRVEATYRTAFIAHVPLETRVAVAEWTDDGRLTIWTGTQVPFGVRADVAEALAIPESAVRVIVPDFGGGFGGKHAGEVALEAARLSRAAGMPVKVRWSREDEFRHGYLRPAAVIDIRAGAGRDGRLTAWQMTNLNSGSFGLDAPYEIANQRVDYQAAESPLRQGSYRGLAATANHFARESAMDEAAVALEIDPLELRLAHLGDERLAAVFREVAERIEWTRARDPAVGLGIAGGIEKDARVATAVELRVGEDRRPRLTRIVTAFDCGRIVNPEALTNQIQGAISMGLGGALFEAVHFERGGVLANASMTDYRVPRMSDLPAIEVVLLDRPDVPSAGAGETPIIALAPAIANAIFDATGVRLRDMPLIPAGRLPR